MPKHTRNIVVLSLMLVGTIAIDIRASARPPRRLIHPLDTIGDNIAGWRASNREVLDEDVLRVLKSSSYLSRTYSRSGGQLNFFVAFYEALRAGEGLHTPRNCLPGSGWEPIEFGTIPVRVGTQRLTVNKYIVGRDSTRMLILYWYQSPARLYANEYMGKAYLLWDALSRGASSGAMVRIALPDSPAAVQQATDFAAGVIPEVQRCMGTAQ